MTDDSRKWVRNTDGEGPEAAAQMAQRERVGLAAKAYEAYKAAWPEALTDEQAEELAGGLGECGWHRCSDLKLGNVDIGYGRVPMVEEVVALDDDGNPIYSPTGRLRVEKRPNKAGRMVRVMRLIPRLPTGEEVSLAGWEEAPCA